ncbi:MAG: RHS repeat-associated core domain-containing protein, partial [Negativicutes bacterium]|nr:RHS repeat-associated core domain-containing protein [Negativicutes bacterium]
LTCDYDNRVSSLTVGAVTTSYVYDFQGGRAQKSTNAPASTTLYIGSIYEVTDSAPTEHIFAGNRRIATKTGSGISYYHPDHLGGLNIATGGTGNVVQSVFYYPYGETRVNTGTVDLHYKFTGKEIDRESGLYYYGARYYDPVIGRFISPDSVVQSPGDPQMFNRYSYARNNPLYYTDPSGHCIIQDIIVGMLFAYGAVSTDTAITLAGIVNAMDLGAALGASISAITGGNPLLGAVTGGVSGGLFFGAGQMIGALQLITPAGAFSSNTALLEAALIHAGAGAASGAIGAAIGGGNVGRAALTGGISAGVAEGIGGGIQDTDWFQGLNKEQKVFAGLSSQIGIGAVTGGVTSEIVDGQFLHGFGQGAWTAAYGFIFNKYFHSLSDGDFCSEASIGPARQDPPYWHQEGYIQLAPNMPECFCYWLYYSDSEGALWSGNYLNLPSSPGWMYYTGSGEGLDSGNNCVCFPPPVP